MYWRLLGPPRYKDDHVVSTWMSSSLELNSDTSTFSPSETLVSETHSRPEANVCASEGRSRFRPDLITLTRLKEGWRGPRFLFLASFATSITSSQHFAKYKKDKGEVYNSGFWCYTFFKCQLATGSIVTTAARSQWPTETYAKPPLSTEPTLRSLQLLVD